MTTALATSQWRTVVRSTRAVGRRRALGGYAYRQHRAGVSPQITTTVGMPFSEDEVQWFASREYLERDSGGWSLTMSGVELASGHDYT